MGKDEGITLFIVEDDEDLLRSLRYFFINSGIRVASATDAIVGLSTMRQLEPDVVLLDLGLPGGGGLKLLEAMHRNAVLSCIPVIVHTSMGSQYKRIALNAGAQAFFTKPADLNDLLASVKKLASNVGPPDIPPESVRAEALQALRRLAAEDLEDRNFHTPAHDSRGNWM